MAREPKNVAASVRARLQNLARSNRPISSACLPDMPLSDFSFDSVSRLTRSSFVLKGAMLYAAWLEDPFRTTRDLDLLSLADRETGAPP